MRTCSTVCLLLVGLAAPVAAQESGFGARSGVALGGLQGLDGAEGRPGAAFGPTFAFRINRWLGVQTELLYAAYGAWLIHAPSVQASAVPFSLASMRYLQLPALARLNVGELVKAPFGALLYAGPHFSAMLSCQLDPVAPRAEHVPCGAAPSSSPFSDMRTFDAGAVAGGSVSVELFRLFAIGADVRYQHGFSRYGPINSGFRQGVWAFAIRLSGTGYGSSGSLAQPGTGYIDTPVPSVIQEGPRRPQLGRPVQGVTM